LSFIDVYFPYFMDAYCQCQGARVGAFRCSTALQALIPCDLTSPTALWLLGRFSF